MLPIRELWNVQSPYLLVPTLSRSWASLSGMSRRRRELRTSLLMGRFSKREGGEPRKLRGTTSPRITFYTTPDAISRLDKFLSDVGVLRKGPSRDDMIEECVGKEVVINVKHVLSDDGESTYANVKYTAPVTN